MEIDSPRAAIELGIGTVYQHLTLVPTLSVLENLMLGSQGGTGRLDLDRGRVSASAELAAAARRRLRARRPQPARWRSASSSRSRS